MLSQSRIRLVLFDLDGTLLDTAPDLLNALNLLRLRHGMTVSEDTTIGQHISRGAAGIIKAGMPLVPEQQRRTYIDEFLQLYASNICLKTRLYPGLEGLLDQLEGKAIKLGLVTNKSMALSEPILHKLGLFDRLVARVYGDTLSVRKPDPAPVLLACEQAGVTPEQTVFIGDDERDIIAGRDAGTQTVAAGWGYFLPHDDPHSWGADAVVETSPQLASLLSGCESRVDQS